MAILKWSQTTPVEWHYIQPGKPQQNAFAESFIGRLRDQRSNETAILVAVRSTRPAGGLAGRLQSSTAPLRTCQPHAGGVSAAPIGPCRGEGSA